MLSSLTLAGECPGDNSETEIRFGGASTAKTEPVALTIPLNFANFINGLITPETGGNYRIILHRHDLIMGGGVHY